MVFGAQQDPVEADQILNGDERRRWRYLFLLRAPDGGIDLHSHVVEDGLALKFVSHVYIPCEPCVSN